MKALFQSKKMYDFMFKVNKFYPFIKFKIIFNFVAFFTVTQI